MQTTSNFNFPIIEASDLLSYAPINTISTIADATLQEHATKLSTVDALTNNVAALQTEIDNNVVPQVATNKADIATNQTNIATNTTAIAQNTSDITSLSNKVGGIVVNGTGQQGAKHYTAIITGLNPTNVDNGVSEYAYITVKISKAQLNTPSAVYANGSCYSSDYRNTAAMSLSSVYDGATVGDSSNWYINFRSDKTIDISVADVWVADLDIILIP